MGILAAFLIGLAVMFFLMLKTKVGPFMSMLFGSLIIGLGCGVNSADTINAIAGGFGNTCKSIGIVIIFGTILGEYLEKSNATQKIATTLLRLTGDKNADVALAATGFVVSIPVFCDVALIMLAPIAKAVAKKSRLKLGALATVLALGLLITNTYVAPTPAPLSIAAILGIDVGQSILWGMAASLFVVVVVWAYCRFFLQKKPDEWYVRSDNAAAMEELDEKMNVGKADVAGAEGVSRASVVTETSGLAHPAMPSFLASVLPILVPIVLILFNTTCSMLLPEGAALLTVSSFLGDKNIALALGILTAILLLKKSIPQKEVYDAMTNALSTAGPVIFITAAGGALAKIIDATGVGVLFADSLAASALPVLIIPFLICGFSKFVQGSSSVAVIMASTLTLPLCNAGLIHPIVAFIAICAGSGFGSHVNNSFFWVFANLFGYDTKTTLKSLCVGQHVMAFAGLFAAFIVSCIL